MTFLLIGAIVVPLIGVPVVYWFSLLLKDKAGYVASLLSLVPLAAVLIAGGDGKGQEFASLKANVEGTVYVSGSAVEQELRGKKISSLSWEQEQLAPQWESKIVEALGFPKVEAQK